MAIDQHMAEVDRLVGLGQYGDAYRYTLEHDTDLEPITDLNELRQMIRQKAREAINAARLELDMELGRDLLDFDRDQTVDNFINLWRQAVIGDSGAELDGYDRRIRTRREDQKEYRFYISVYDEVKDLWSRAQDEARGNAAANVLKELYDRAYDIARNAAAEHPENTRLQELAQQAHARRERANIEQEAMTSGALLEQYVRTLVYVDAARDDEHLQLVDRFGNPMGRHTKDRARREVEDQARAFVDARMVEYLDKARRELNDQKPRAAKAALDEYHKFEEPEDPNFDQTILGGIALKPVSLSDLVPDLISSGRMREVIALENEIQQAITQLGDAEAYARDVLEVLDRDIVEAWRLYRNALDAYAGASNSEVVSSARDELEKVARMRLDEDTKQVNNLISQQKFADAETRTGNTLGTFQPMKDSLRIGANLRVLDEIHGALQSVRETLARIDNALENDNLDAAARELTGLEANYALRRYYEGNPLYDRLKGEVTFRLDAEAELARLREFLNNPRREKVERALESARAAAETGSAFNQEFDDLVVQLDAHLLDLDVDRLLATEGYAEVIARLEETVAQPMLGPTLHTKLINRLEDLRNRSRELDTDRDTMDRAQQQLRAGNPQDAYKLLQQIKNFSTLDERRNRDRLLADAREQRTQQIRGRFRDLTINTSFDRSEMQDLLVELDELDPDQAQRVKGQFRMNEGAQLARDSENGGKLNEALEHWQNLMGMQPGFEDAAYIRKQITLLTKRQKAAEIARLLEPGERGTDEEAFSEWIGQLIAVVRDLAQNATDANDPVDRIEYTIWRAQVMLTHAQYTPDLKTRRTLLNDLSDIARTLENQIKTVEKRQLGQAEKDVIARAQITIPAAKAGPEIGEAMREVEDRLQPDAEIALFRQALQRWHSTFAAYEGELPALQRWFSDHVHMVQTTLRENLQAFAENGQENHADLTPETLPLYAKLLVLDREDPAGNWMLRQLERLSARIDGAVEELRQSAFSSEGIPPGHGQQTLEEKRDDILNYLTYIRLIRDLVEWFRHLDELRDQGNVLIATCGLQIQKLEGVHRRLQRFLGAGMDFDSFVKNYEPRDDGKNSWRDFENEFKRAWDDFLQQVIEIDDELDQHPWVDNELRARFEKRASELRDLVKLLVDIQNDMQAERFIEADQKARSIEDTLAYKRMFPRMMLHTEYRVKDVWTDSERMGWPNVLDLIEKRRTCFEIVYDWAAPFGAPATVEPMHLAAEYTPPPAPIVVDWTAISKKAKTLEQQGNFVDARKTIYGALDGPDADEDDDRLGLRAALERVNRPPVAEDGGPAGDYTVAQKRAGSKRGWNILEWMERHRQKLYTRQIADAQRALTGIDATDNDWNRRITQFNGVLSAIDEVLESRMGRKARRQRLGELSRDAHQVLGALRELCPQHPQVDNLANHPILMDAMRGSK